ncbi:MAG: bifunctional nuclease family protein [Deltaproteobacteria bacterium]|nr:bifunctional nuclease family protein [Deltaproteobacteria bacterium]
MSNEAAIEMFVAGLVLDPNTQAPVVVLKDEGGTVHIPIWIGIAEATSIASAIKQLPMARPLTHDLMYDIFQQMSVKVERVVVTELKDSTYYAELILSIGDRAVILDSRPSDAIAVALRASAPIFVAEKVIEQAKASFSVVPQEGAASSSQGQSGAASDASDTQDEQQDFKQIDKDKWREILDKLDPDDFKFKM